MNLRVDKKRMLDRIEFLLDRVQTPGFCFDRNRYFLDAFSNHSNVPLNYWPISAKLFAQIRHIKGVYSLWLKWANLQAVERYPLTSNHIGRYHFIFGSIKVKVAIDTADGRHLHDESILDWSDIYFKCNAWPQIEYPGKVVSLMNGNGTLSPSKIERLKALRNHKKDFDLVYWSRIWAAPGNAPENNGVEHNVRIFEALAKVEGRKNLLAVFPEEMDCPSLQEYRDRLDSVGVKWQNGWQNVDSDMLWNSLATAHVNFLRPGNHLCVSWRMVDLLCMGACIMLDGEPFARWPEPLQNDVNFVDSQCTLSADYVLPADDTYAELTARVSALVVDKAKIRKIAKNNQEYYDQYASLAAVSDYVLRVIEDRYPEVSDTMQLA